MELNSYKNRINCFIFFSLIISCNSLYGQLSREDSLHISNILNQKGEIKLNEEAIKSISFGNNGRPAISHNNILNAIIYKPTIDLYQRQLLPPDFHFIYHDYSSIHLKKLSIKAFIDENGSKTFHPNTNKSINLLMNYQFNGKLSVDFFGGYVYKAFLPQLLYDKEIGTRVIYKINNRINIHTGFQLQHNKKINKWGSAFFTGVSYNLH